MLDPERRRFEPDKRNRPRPSDGPEQAKANPPKERPKPPDGTEEANDVPPSDDLYRPTMEELQREIRRLQSERRDIIKLKPGDNTFRVIPYKERGCFFELIRYHYGVGPRRRGMRCLQDFEEACFFCEKVAELSKSPDPDDQAEAKAMKQTKRCLLYVIMLDEPEKGVQVLSLPASSVASLWSYFSDPEFQDWLHPERGRNAKIRKTGEGWEPATAIPSCRRGRRPFP